MFPTFTYNTTTEMPTTAATTTTQLELVQHPLDITPMNYNDISPRDSLCYSDYEEDEDEDDETGQQTPSNHNWNDLLSHFNSQPDMIKLIQLCKQEEDKRRQEESSLELKQHLVLRQLQYIQSTQHREAREDKELQLQLPPSPSTNEKK